MSTTERLLLDKLSPSEKKALELKSQGHTRATAAAEMGVGRNHLKNLWQRVNRKAREIVGEHAIPAEIKGRTVRACRLSELHQV